MQPSDKAKFKDMLTDALAFYRRDVTPFALSVWWSACQPFALEQIGKALTAHAMDPERGQFPPMPADIVKQLHGTFTDRSLVAWGKVLEAIQRVGAYQSVVFDDGAIHAAIEDIGGWVTICRSEMEELPHLQRRFMESHRVHVKRGTPAFPARLPGAHELENTIAGRKSAPPVLIGDVKAAQEVMQAGVETSRVAITPLQMVPAFKRIAAA